MPHFEFAAFARTLPTQRDRDRFAARARHNGREPTGRWSLSRTT